MPSSSFSSMSERLSPRTYSHPTLDPEILEVDEHNSNDSSSLINSTKSIGSSEADGSGGQQFPDVHKPASRFHKMCITISLGVLFIGAVTFLVVLFALPSSSSCEDAVGATSCDIFCSGLILQTIQFGGLFNDSKTFVDMPLTRHPQCVKDDFESMEDYSKESLYEFLLRNFEPSCTDMLLWQPSDYLPTPPFLAQIKDSAIADWACDLNGLWNLLGRALDPDVYRHPERHTLLPLRSPYMIVPGGRFCEFYYWDSYWIIQGLLVSDMIDTAKGIVENFLGLVADYGFVPNGSRRYYLNRSQPPMLTLMVKEVYEYTGDVEWLKSALPILELEYQFWMEPDTRAVKIVDENGDAHILNRYYTDNKLPRPESYVQDQLTAWLLHNMTHGEKMSDHMKERLKRFHFEKLELNHLNDAIRYQSSAAYHNLAHYTVDDDDDDDDVDVDHDDVVDHDSNPSSSVGGGPARRLRDAVIPPSPVPSFHNESNIELLFAEIAAAAESGWDFSSRWFHDRFNLTSVETMDLIPVDLNAIMYAVEKNIGQFFAIIDDRKKASAYAQRAADRMVAIDSVLWNSETNQWNDYHIDRDEWKKEVVISNFVPLWTKCYDTSIVNEGAVISSLLASGLVMDGGLVTTLNNNTQQWDFPNAWAPIQWMVNEGIASSRYRSASSYDNFHIYNSTLLKPGEPIPSHACDIARPEEWANCTASVTTGAADGEGVTTESKSESESDMINIDCVWCFPPPEDLSKALSFRWLLSNYVAFNHTGYMLEKYYAPIVGGAGEGGEYHLQKGFGWSNGVALGWIAKYTNDTEFHIDKMSTHPFPYSRMAAPEVYDKLSLPESPLLTHPLKDQVESQIYHRSHTHGYKPNNNSTLSSHSKMNMKKKMMMKKKKRHHRERQRQDDEGSQYSPVGYPTTNNNNIVRQVLV